LGDTSIKKTFTARFTFWFKFQQEVQVQEEENIALLHIADQYSKPSISDAQL